MFLPETICLNSNYKLQEKETYNFYYTFDLLPDISFNQLKEKLAIYCIYDQQSSQTIKIEWQLDPRDLGWISTIFKLMEYQNYTQNNDDIYFI